MKSLQAQRKIYFEEEIEVTPRGLILILRILERTEEPLQLGSLLERLGPREHSLLMILICLVLEPLPILSSLAGPLVFILAVLQYRNRPLWMPRFLRERVIQPPTLQRASHWGGRLEKFLHRFVRPRWEFFLQTPFFRIFNLIFVSAVALILAIPMPLPLTNFLPAAVLILMSLAQLEKDGALVLASYVLFASSTVLLYSMSLWALQFFPG